MTNPADEQRRRNQQSRDAWEAFAAHRRQITDLLVDQIARAGVAGHARLCVFGAGNCNDLDLTRLTPLCAEIHLVDLDGEALVEGLARQAPPLVDRIHPHGDIDLSGLLGHLSASPPARPFGETANRETLVRAVRESQPGGQVPAPFDVVASVRLRHLQLIVEWLRPGGRGLLITDVVSSVTCPTLASTPIASLPALLRDLIAQHNFFTGLNPGVIEQQLRTGPHTGERLDNVVALPPWIWDLGPRVYAVCAWSFERRKDECVSPE